MNHDSPVKADLFYMCPGYEQLKLFKANETGSIQHNSDLAISSVHEVLLYSTQSNLQTHFYCHMPSQSDLNLINDKDTTVFKHRIRGVHLKNSKCKWAHYKVLI